MARKKKEKQEEMEGCTGGIGSMFGRPLRFDSYVVAVTNPSRAPKSTSAKSGNPALFAGRFRDLASSFEKCPTTHVVSRDQVCEQAGRTLVELLRDCHVPGLLKPIRYEIRFKDPLDSKSEYYLDDYQFALTDDDHRHAPASWLWSMCVEVICVHYPGFTDPSNLRCLLRPSTFDNLSEKEEELRLCEAYRDACRWITDLLHSDVGQAASELSSESATVKKVSIAKNAVEEEPPLSDQAIEVLRILDEHETGPNNRMTRDRIADLLPARDDADAVPTKFGLGPAMRDLRDREFVATKEGRGGGNWLTREGKDFVRSLASKPQNVGG
jgi:hypothetical protein